MTSSRENEPIPLLVLAEFVCSESGDPEFRSHLDRTLQEVRAIPGCLHAVVWSRPPDGRPSADPSLASPSCR